MSQRAEGLEAENSKQLLPSWGQRIGSVQLSAGVRTRHVGFDGPMQLRRVIAQTNPNSLFP